MRALPYANIHSKACQTEEKEALMKPRSKLIVKIIVFALVIYAGISLIAIRGRIDAAAAKREELRRTVAELELSNAELEYEIDNCNDPEVIAGIARSNLGLVLQDEVVFYDGGTE